MAVLEVGSAVVMDGGASGNFGFGGTNSSARGTGGFGFGGEASSSLQLRWPGGGGGGWYGGSGGSINYGSTMAGGGGGSGFVFTEYTISDVPTGFLLNGDYYLSEAQTIAGNQSFPAPGGGNETGHSGNGYARITLVE